MAVDLLSENSNMSPRISFSRDFCQADAIPIEKRPLRPSSSSNSKPSSLHSSVDFDFCIPGVVNSGESFDQGSWSADELFCNGKILPTEIKKKPESPPPHGKRNPGQKGSSKDDTCRPDPGDGKTGRTKPDSKKQRKPIPTKDEEDNDDVIVSTEEKSNTKSFWGFKRSSSLNCGSSYGRSLCPLPLLSRSNSTGSTSSKQKQSSRKHTEHIKLQQSSSVSSSSTSSSSSTNSSFQKPPLKKSYGGYSYGSHGGSGIRVSPVINMVPSGNLFGLGSIFAGNGRDRNKKR